MIAYPAALKAVGGAKTGIAPVNLLDIQTLNNGQFYWSDRKLAAPPAIAPFSLGITPPAPPVTVPTGQLVAWAYPTQVSATGSFAGGTGLLRACTGSAVGTVASESLNATGDVEFSISGSLGNNVAGVLWSQFIPNPALPADAVIQAIYPVLVASAVQDIADQYASYGSGMSIETGQGTPFASPSAATGTFASTEFYGPSIGTSLAALSPAEIQVVLNTSLVENPVTDDFQVTAVAYAIYYTSASAASGVGLYDPWLLSVPSFSFHRSLQTDIGSFVVQNLSGDTLSRDVEKILRASAMEGAFFVYRLWQPDAEAAWLEVHGTLTVQPVGVDTMTLKGTQLLNPSQDDTPLEIYCETCQLQWAGLRCGATGSTECEYSYQTCQVIERIMVVTNDYEKNFGETTANTALNVINRRRKI